jgi:hypothetical protein
MCHAIISLLIAAVLWWPLGLTAGLAAGVAFYAGREFTQWEGGLPFDWLGILAPATVCISIYVISILV